MRKRFAIAICHPMKVLCSTNYSFTVVQILDAKIYAVGEKRRIHLAVSIHGVALQQLAKIQIAISIARLVWQFPH